MNELLNADLPVNLFDGVVYLLLAVAIIAGFRSGLLRSLATIFGYVIAAPVAVAIMPSITPILTERFKLPPAQSSLAFFVVFLVIGFIVGALLRGAVGEISGARISAPDRAAGAFLGAIRIVLLAVVMVLVFERIIPAGREPAFLKDSTLRPILSQAGQEGLRKLPPDVTEFIDRMKREKGL
ncbi:MAG: CvpA family protein [Pseudolabrys sp.]|nr:CvpA family protein [Pseudolabrys sp.]MDP2298216.1 CvpA family protein [Pseudolabrys sp.]